MRARVLPAALLVCAAFPGLAGAHRLDEYLQATRISVEPHRIATEINLTPGAAVADEVFAAMDRDHNNEISPAESAAYAESVVRSLSLSVDGQLRRLTLGAYSIPSLADMQHGEGIIRLHASAKTPPTPAGRHQLRFSNTYRSDIGVYMINALVPADARIRISGQSRDMLQHEFKMDYTVSEGNDPGGLATALPPMLGLVLAAGFYFITKRI
jgi:hypothetical protein